MEFTTFLSTLRLPALPAPIEPASLYAALAQVHDGRKRRGRRYPLPLVLTLLMLGKLAGETTVSGIAHWARLRTEWLGSVLKLPYTRLPCANTYTLVSDKVDLEELNAALAQAFVPVLPLPSEPPSLAVPPPRGSRHLALDGKPLRGTRRHAPTSAEAVHVLGLYDVTYQGLVAPQQVIA